MPLSLALRPVLVAAIFALSAVPVPVAAQAQSGAVPLAAHRAVYDLKLKATRGKTAMSAVRGRILYDFSGSPCEGYALQFRQVSELDSGEGKTAIADLRATSWEAGDAKRLRFHSQNYLDNELRDTVDGEAAREPNGVEVKLTEPGKKQLDLKNDLVFPTEHVRRIIAAAHAGNHQLFRSRRGRTHRRANPGLRHHIRALRERRVARPGARLRRLRAQRRYDVA